MWDLAFASFTAQSGLILSVAMTVGALADIDVVRLLCVCGASDVVVPVAPVGEDGLSTGGVSRP